MAAITYTPQQAISGPTFTCRRCRRVYAYPKANGRPVRCECGWWYTNVGNNKVVEEFNPRIGGSDSEAPQAS
jgi:hypothetical protein